MSTGPLAQLDDRAVARPELASALRMSIARLARLLRQQDKGGFGPTITAALSTVAKDGPLTLGELAAREQVQPPTITKVVEKLETYGFVTRCADSADRRVSRVSVTAAGRAQLAEISSRRTAWLAQRLSELTADEISRLEDVVDVLETLTQAPGGAADVARGAAASSAPGEGS